MKLVKKINWPILLLPILIFIIGQITLISTAPNLAKNQLIFFIIGYVIFLLVSVFDYRLIKLFFKPIYFLNIFVLVVVFILGARVFGSTRWLEIGSFNFQPSEFTKIVAIITISAQIAKNRDYFREFKYFFGLLFQSFLLFVLVFLQPDLGTSLIIGATLVGILWFADLPKKYFLGALTLIGLISAPLWNFLKDYQKERILTFLNPTSDALGSGYNVIQSTIAIGSGRLLGKGFGHGTQSHLQFLPVYWTDFIFAAFAEEWGFVGVVGLLVLYLGLLISIFYIALDTKDTFGSLLVMGVFVVFSSQFVINIGMNLGLMPVTGIPLPLVSYGGSSLLSSMIMLGLAHSVWIHRRI